MARTLIWTAAPTATLQLALHKEGSGPAALVPVSTGTVLLPARRGGFPSAVRLADRCREIGGTALVLRWSGSTQVGSDGTRTTYQGSVLSAMRLAGPVTWWRLKGRERGDAELTADVTQVVGLVDEGRADAHVAGLPSSRTRLVGLPINTMLPVVPVTQGAAPTEPPLA
ncbi:hypothetical protein [Umezawaea sp. Da 62-37]|uniref:hypothetical protein n=1 Tax=Umezawaea sp. Da 62-37 TaxID=3075927 RepID=UPI0028F71BE0|nr:hypothetical protein [Umezawaea sp. Da 62-37]WNV89670.1 hypothetical protein RM788_15610 [Umezawaea sp. Da 62-37]